ncbi:MAG: riboflavin synthase [Ferruginibacter sp.]|jgi:riboflavin synthase
MFTGIIEATGLITDIKDIGGNRIFRVESPISHELKIDQSLSHNGVCLTVEDVQAGTHQVTAIAETLLKTNLGSWAPGTRVNLERCMAMNGRLDGHIVQGHVDDTATCVARREKAGSWEFSFRTNPRFAGLMIEKGSISLNGISLTIFHVTEDGFTVAIIPYTFGHTNMKELQEGDTVNIEFDMIGKYVNRLATLRLS